LMFYLENWRGADHAAGEAQLWVWTVGLPLLRLYTDIRHFRPRGGRPGRKNGPALAVAA
jgi:hypothetical protein